MPSYRLSRSIKGKKLTKRPGTLRTLEGSFFANGLTEPRQKRSIGDERGLIEGDGESARKSNWGEWAEWAENRTMEPGYQPSLNDAVEEGATVRRVPGQFCTVDQHSPTLSALPRL